MCEAPLRSAEPRLSPLLPPNPLIPTPLLHRRVHAAEEAARGAPLLVRLQQQAAHALDGWRSYFAQPILPSSLTCVLLFFNVVLSPGGLITAFLTSRGFDGNAMAAFRGGCASEWPHALCGAQSRVPHLHATPLP